MGLVGFRAEPVVLSLHLVLGGLACDSFLTQWDFIVLSRCAEYVNCFY